MTHGRFGFAKELSVGKTLVSRTSTLEEQPLVELLDGEDLFQRPADPEVFFEDSHGETDTVGGFSEQFRPGGRGPDVRRGSIVDLNEFLRNSIDPVDSETSVFQKLLSFQLGKRTLQY